MNMPILSKSTLAFLSVDHLGLKSHGDKKDMMMPHTLDN